MTGRVVRVYFLDENDEPESTADVPEPLPDYMTGDYDSGGPLYRYQRGTAQMVTKDGTTEVVVYSRMAAS